MQTLHVTKLPHGLIGRELRSGIGIVGSHRALLIEQFAMGIGKDLGARRVKQSDMIGARREGYGFQQMPGGTRIERHGFLGLLKACRHMRLPGQMINLVWPQARQQAGEVGPLAYIKIMQLKPGKCILPPQPRAIKSRRLSCHAMNHIAFGQQQVGQISTILSRDARDQGDLSTIGMRIRRHISP